MGSVIKNRRPALTCYANGMITVPSWTMKALELEPGDAINLWEERGEVYLYGISHAPQSYRARLCPNNKASRLTCRCRSAELSRYILGKMGGERCAAAAGDVKEIPVGKGLQLILRHIC